MGNIKGIYRREVVKYLNQIVSVHEVNKIDKNIWGEPLDQALHSKFINFPAPTAATYVSLLSNHPRCTRNTDSRPCTLKQKRISLPGGAANPDGKVCFFFSVFPYPGPARLIFSNKKSRHD